VEYETSVGRRLTNRATLKNDILESKSNINLNYPENDKKQKIQI